MGTAARKNKPLHSRRKAKGKSMTKAEMIQKMLADQKIIQQAREKGISYEELEKNHGFKFARLPH